MASSVQEKDIKKLRAAGYLAKKIGGTDCPYSGAP